MSDGRVAALRVAWERAVEKDKTGDAIKALAELENLEPREAQWSHRLGDACRRAGRTAEAAEAFARATKRYQSQGFLPRAIAMAKLAASLDPSFGGLIETLTPEPAAAVRPPALPPMVKPAPLARAQDEDEDEVRFEDAPPSSISIVIEDVSEVLELDDTDVIEVVRPPQATVPDLGALPSVREPSIDRLGAMVGFRLFADLSREALVALSSAAELIEFVPSAMVIMRDEPAFALYAIVGGKAKVEVPGAPPVRLVEGDVFGESCLLEEGKRQANVRAETHLTTLRIGKSALDAIVAEHPSVQDALFEMLARRLVSNLVVTSELFRFFDPPQKLELAQMFEARRAEPGTVIAERGRRTDGLYILLAGDVLSTDSSGVETRIARGTTFGHASLLGGAPSDVSVKSVGEAVLLRLPAAKFASLAALYPPALAHLAETADQPLRPSLIQSPPKRT